MQDETMEFGVGLGVGFVIGIIFGLLFLVPIGGCLETARFQKEAIKHNKAHYVIQPDGSAGWEWIPEPEKK